MLVPVGATLALFIQPIPGQLSVLMKYSSGGTCEILPAGLTQIAHNIFLPRSQAAATLAAISGSGYAFSSGEAITVDGPVSFYLSSTGATSVIHAIFTKGQGL